MRPSAAGYDPSLPEVVANPYPWYELLRSDEPCHYLADRDTYVISRYYDVVRIATELPPPETPAPVVPPDFTRQVHTIAAGFVDAMLAKGDQAFDLVEVLARPFPLAVADALGQPSGHGAAAVTDVIGNATLTLMADPLQWRAVQNERGLVPCLIEECLRYEPPVHGRTATTTAATDVDGTKIPPGASVLLLFGSANRDPAHYPEPDRFEPSRNPVDHVGFGAGGLVCPGAALARIEAGAMAGAILDRVAAIRPAGPWERTTEPLTRGVTTLPVTVEPR